MTWQEEDRGKIDPIMPPILRMCFQKSKLLSFGNVHIFASSRGRRGLACCGAMRSGDSTPVAHADTMVRILEPTPITSPPPFQPPGNWLVRSCRAVWRERRLPTSVRRGLDRLAIACGWSLKTIRADSLHFRVRRLTSDEHYVHEVITERQYTPCGDEIHETDTVIDIGANIGSFAVMASRLAPRGRVLCLEPVGDNYRLLRDNLNRNACRNVTAVQAAVVAESRPTTVYLSPDGTGSHSIFPAFAGAAARTEAVAGIGLADLFAAHGVTKCDFLKIDCEGAEFEILLGLPGELFPRIRRLAIEYHTQSPATKRAEADALLDHLQAAGFVVETYTDILGTNRGMISARSSGT